MEYIICTESMEIYLKEIFYSLTKITLQVLVFYYFLFLSSYLHKDFQEWKVELTYPIN